MGCCAANTKLQTEIPFEKMEDYEKLKLEIEQFLSSKDQNERTNTNLILDLVIKTSKQISKYEDELNKLKRDETEKNEELIESLTQDIKLLKDYNTKLNDLLKESENISDNIQQKEIINENEIIINKKEEENINNLKSETKINNKENINNLDKENNDIYFKKSIRRNKKGLINQKYNYNNINIGESENNKNIEIVDTSDNLHLIANNIINIIFELENGEKVEIQAMKNEKFIDTIRRLGEKNAVFDDLEKLQFFDGKDNITEKIINEMKVEDFKLNDFHVIQVKSLDNIN